MHTWKGPAVYTGIITPSRRVVVLAHPDVAVTALEVEEPDHGVVVKLIHVDFMSGVTSLDDVIEDAVTYVLSERTKLVRGRGPEKSRLAAKPAAPPLPTVDPQENADDDDEPEDGDEEDNDAATA